VSRASSHASVVASATSLTSERWELDMLAGILRLARHAIGMYHRHLHLSEAAFDAVTKGG
jgi:hypothetical protein